ncbi:interleukin-20 [Megaptera novaeangliae]
MKGSGLPLCLLSAVFYLFWTPSARVKTLHLGSCVITASLQAIRSGFSEIRDRGLQPKDEIIDLRILRKTQPLQDTKPAGQCCLLCHILRLYLDKVFKNYQTPDHRILQKISGLTNSFLTIKKDLWLCHAHMTCPCGEEAMEKYSQLMSHFQELQPQAAVVKALGELDILLSWMEEMD